MSNAIKKYETVPKRKEMISNSMFHYLASHASKDSLVRTITDWIALGCYTGFCKSEWCATIDDHNWGDWPNALPIIPEDFSFTSVSGRCIHNVDTTPNEDITFTTLCFRKQTMTMVRHSPTGIALTRTGCAPYRPALTLSGARSASARPPIAPPWCTTTQPPVHAISSQPGKLPSSCTMSLTECLTFLQFTRTYSRGLAIPFVSQQPTSSITLGSLIHTSKTASGGAATRSSCILLTPSTWQTNTHKLSHSASICPTAASPGLWNPTNPSFALEPLNQDYTLHLPFTTQLHNY
jgi:hypothetical protein